MVKSERLNTNQIAKLLFGEIIGSVNSNDSLELLNDLCSSKEIKIISRRLLIAGLRYRGMTFKEIADLLNCGENLVNKVHFKTRGSKLLLQLVIDSKVFDEYFGRRESKKEIDPDPLSRRSNSQLKRSLFLE